MTTFEKKVDLVARYIDANDRKTKALIKEELHNLLQTENGESTFHRNHVVEDLLTEIGCPCNARGYSLLTYAIQLIVDDPTYLEGITKRLYPELATRFGITQSATERAMRHCIELGFSRGDPDDIYAVFGNTVNVDKCKPTNKEFLATCAKVVKRRMEEMV